MDIDYERLELVLGACIHESVRGEFDIPAICQAAKVEKYQGHDAIVVNGGPFVFIFDLVTYKQLFGAGV